MHHQKCRISSNHTVTVCCGGIAFAQPRLRLKDNGSLLGTSGARRPRQGGSVPSLSSVLLMR
jgi:hypothetical protein